MNKRWYEVGWEDYLFWQQTDKKKLKKINDIIKSIERDGIAKGLGKPEPLKYRKGWSRRIDHENRIIYDIDEQGNLLINRCKGHYEEK